MLEIIDYQANKQTVGGHCEIFGRVQLTNILQSANSYCWRAIVDMDKVMLRNTFNSHVCKQVNETILKSIVTYPNQDYFYATNFSQLTESLDRIVSSSCRAVVNQCTTPLAPTTTTREPTLSNTRFILIMISWLSSYGLSLFSVCL